MICANAENNFSISQIFGNQILKSIYTILPSDTILVVDTLLPIETILPRIFIMVYENSKSDAHLNFCKSDSAHVLDRSKKHIFNQLENVKLFIT